MFVLNTLGHKLLSTNQPEVGQEPTESWVRNVRAWVRIVWVRKDWYSLWQTTSRGLD